MQLDDLNPSKIIAVHLNYQGRASERGRVPGEPSYFLKPPSSLARGGGPVARPAGCEYLNYEGEIAVVIGARVRRVGVEEAAGAIGWISAANDFGLYDLRWADRGSNLMAKGQDGFTPIGPRLVPASELDLGDLWLRTRRNGEVVQEESTATLIFDFAHLIADLSRFVTLEVGDVILAGTPANSRPVDVGDVVEVELDGVGVLRSEVVEGPPLAEGLGAMPKMTPAARAMSIGASAPRPAVLSDAARDALNAVSTATLTVQLRKRGIANTFLGGLKPARPDKRMLGYAHTLRYVAMREDVPQPLNGGLNYQKATIEARDEAGAGTIGDILMTRLMVRGAAGVVTDGGLRDSPTIEKLDWPAYCGARSAPLNLVRHHAVESQVPIGCGGVAVYPGDVLVGDAEGVVVIPAKMADEVAKEAEAQTQFEDWVEARVKEGRSIFGLYPPSAETKAEFEAWKNNNPKA
jgi:2-keto-4-pentenoate hydratase/2-oxohepta-3-ene-1,7-dioic acid hydratase in catechol pathway/regulator of RNase E activity RraA